LAANRGAFVACLDEGAAGRDPFQGAWMSPGSIATSRRALASPANLFSRTTLSLDLSQPSIHIPVLADEALAWLAPRAGQTFVDGTLGGAGHFRRLADALWPPGEDADSRLIGIDRDRQAVDAARERIAGEGLLTGRRIELHHGNFRDLPEILDSLAIDLVDGVLLDLGLSSDQLADESRGFSFTSEGPFDLRFDTDDGRPAWQWLERKTANDLADLIYHFGEERFSRRIARAIVEARAKTPLVTAVDVADVIRRAVPRAARHGQRIDPSTRTFQALRIAVNEELESLDEALRVIPDRLRPRGRLAIISFHSLEDRRVKEAFRGDPRLKPLTKKPVRPSPQEIDANPRSRSSRLRVAERTA
jgi:16S rRNA (cytosine1402-N4)-methyltransferase